MHLQLMRPKKVYNLQTSFCKKVKIIGYLKHPLQFFKCVAKTNIELGSQNTDGTTFRWTPFNLSTLCNIVGTGRRTC